MSKIMLVDDEVHVLRILKLTLERQGYDIETYNNGQEALNALGNGHPDVLVTDIQMPRMTGEELCNQIRAKYPERTFLIIVLTSRTEIEHREWSATFDNLQFLEKPVSMRNLVKLLDKHLTQQNID